MPASPTVDASDHFERNRQSSVMSVVSGLTPGGGTPRTTAICSEMSLAICTSTSGRGFVCEVSTFVCTAPRPS